jgi:hypothetical protein
LVGIAVKFIIDTSLKENTVLLSTHIDCLADNEAVDIADSICLLTFHSASNNVTYHKEIYRIVAVGTY